MFRIDERNRFGRLMTGRAMVATLVMMCCLAIVAVLATDWSAYADEREGGVPGPKNPTADFVARYTKIDGDKSWFETFNQGIQAIKYADGQEAREAARHDMAIDMWLLYADDATLLPTAGGGIWMNLDIFSYFINVFLEDVNNLPGEVSFPAENNPLPNVSWSEGNVEAFASFQGLYEFANKEPVARFTFVYRGTWVVDGDDGGWTWQILDHHSSWTPEGPCPNGNGERSGNGDEEVFCPEVPECLKFDHNNDGMIDGHDLLALLAAWGQCPPDDGDE